jgi:hypothetical protein
MSWTDNNKKAKNPAKKFIEFKSSKGFYYYDKEKQETVFLKDKFYIIPMERLSTITGYHKKTKSGIYSNEVSYTDSEVMTVRSFKGEGNIAKGLYNEIKGNLAGGKFTISVYGAMINGVKPNNTVELVNIKFHGGALTPVIEGLPKDFKGEIVGLSLDPKPAPSDLGDYNVPLVEVLPPNDKFTALTEDMYVELQEYLTQYKATNNESN